MCFCGDGNCNDEDGLLVAAATEVVLLLLDLVSNRSSVTVLDLVATEVVLLLLDLVLQK